MNGEQPVGALLREVIAGMLREDTDEVSLDVTLPINGQKVRCTFDLTLTGCTPIAGEDAP